MLDLVLWSGALAVAPLALDLIWRLISGGVGRNGRAAPTGMLSTDNEDVDGERPDDWHGPLRRRAFHASRRADIDRHRSCEP
jgi:hypothetical protein